jgi:bifunctional UDP-N-acetylglucosamine pyrophosphorylase/glucosamine-1-phosphate N-acetyltransferase
MKTAAIILAAGKGKRMNSDLPKVLHKLNGKALVNYVIELAENVQAEPIVVVVGHGGELVKDHLGEGLSFAVQAEQKGTASAVMCAQKALENFDGDVLIFCGDSPLFTKESVDKLVELHKAQDAKGTILTAINPNPFGYGRIIRREDGSVEKIVEEKDATEEEKRVNEVNTGTYCFDKKALFEALKEVDADNAQGELYLTDVIEILNRNGQRVTAYSTDDWKETVGVNTPEGMAEAEKILAERSIK